MTEITGRLSTALADRYKIERHLGEGGMANVYLAHDLKHDRKVAVKVLRPELAAVLGAERFVQEIKTTANLQHPHILPLHDSGDADGFLYYVMPFIDGETLRDKLNRETQLGIDEAVNLTTAIADALDYAHRQNVIHIHTISLGGGPPLMLTASAIANGGSWGDDGMVYFTNRTTRGISRVPANGSAVETITIPDSAKGEVGHLWVDVLPASKGAIFMIARGGLDQADIGIVNFATGEVQVAVRGTFARYASSGHLVYTRSDGTLLVAPFDADALELTGPSTPILDGLVVQAQGEAQFTVSRSGHLIYQTGDQRSTEQFVWVDRSGVEQIIAMEQQDYDFPRLSPDGSRVAVTVGAQGAGGGDIFVHRFEPPTLSRLTFEGLNNYPTWSHDGRRIPFTSDREIPRSLYQKAADGTGPAELVYAAGFDLWEGLTSPDERWLIVRDNVGGDDRTIHYIELGSDTTLREFGLREFNERSPVLSPDGQWLAYTSDESGRDEIYVRPFPPDRGGKWQVSSGGGAEPTWAHSGRELFYRSGGVLMAADVQTTPAFAVGTRTTLFEVRAYNGSPQRANYAVDRTDQRFLFVKGSQGSRELVVVLNWLGELKSRIGG